MKVLITGGAGFVGSHLAEALLARGDQVEILDNLSTGSIDNIEHLKGARGFRYTVDSVMNEPVTAEVIDRADVVFHLAAAVGVRLIVESPVNTIEKAVRSLLENPGRRREMSARGRDLVDGLGAHRTAEVILDRRQRARAPAEKTAP